MKWLLRRLSILWLTLTLLCAAVVAVGWLDHTPSKLQTIGLALCDGEPCFKGIKLGTDWISATHLFPDAVMKQGYLHLPTTGKDHAVFGPSKDETTVDEIVLLGANSGPLPITADDVIAQYGAPCRVYLEYNDGVPGNAILIYPKMKMDIDIQMKTPDNTFDYRLQLNSAVWDFIIAVGNTPGTCNDATYQNFGAWHGFISAEEYRQDNFNDMGIAQPHP